MTVATAKPHVPVLLTEVIDALAIAPGETHVDGTFGAGGYSAAMLEACARVHAFDQDPRPAEAGDGDAILRIGEHRLAIRGAGLFVRTEAGKGAEPNCRLSDHNLLARCAIGEGQATLVADADFLDARFWSDDSVAAAGKSAAGRFIDALVYAQLKPESRAQ